MTSEKLTETLQRRRGEIETKIRKGYDGQAELRVSELHGDAFLIFRIPNSEVKRSFEKQVKIDDEFVGVMIKCGDKRFPKTTQNRKAGESPMYTEEQKSALSEINGFTWESAWFLDAKPKPNHDEFIEYLQKVEKIIGKLETNFPEEDVTIKLCDLFDQAEASTSAEEMDDPLTEIFKILTMFYVNKICK